MTALLAANSTRWKTIDLLRDWDAFQPAWDDFVARHPKGSIFHTSAMIQVFAAAKGHSVVALAAVSDSGEILSLLVANRVQTLPNVFGAVSSRSVSYAEPLCVDSPDGVDGLSSLLAAHDRILKRRALFAEVRPLCASGPERVALERCGYRHLDYLNYIIDTTQPVETIWSRLHDSAKSYVKKCQKRRFELRHLQTPDCVDVLYEFLRATYGRAGVPLADRSLFEAAYKFLKPRNMITFVVVYDGDTPVAADTLLLFNKKAFAWYGGSVRLTGLSPAAFMQWQEIAWSCENGFDQYDFGGAGWPNVPYGVRDFKASFGGELVCYGRYRKIFSRWKMALAERAYEIGRSVISPK
ncbi:MAG TPA: GNAT family N-acetyltransferase [Lacipirellulaceae bacterium]|nr:GNAT family N-acetyltransferase [Lacipirellulaceae bacterium]